MNVLVMADTHLTEARLPRSIAAQLDEADACIHAGDLVSMSFYEALEGLVPVYAVCGNSDDDEVRSLLREHRVFVLGGVRIGVVHSVGDWQPEQASRYRALEMGVDVLVYGHLHRPLLSRSEVLTICPGSPTYPRMSEPSVVWLHIHEGNVYVKVVPIGKPACEYLNFSKFGGNGVE